MGEHMTTGKITLELWPSDAYLVSLALSIFAATELDPQAAADAAYLVDRIGAACDAASDAKAVEA